MCQPSHRRRNPQFAMTPINEIDERMELRRRRPLLAAERRARPPLDLNLLVVLDALLVHRHVSRAAAALGVGQPAASAALKRLRRHYGDVLLERSGNTYVLTPFAAELATRVGAALSEVRRVADAGIGFDAASAQRTFEHRGLRRSGLRAAASTAGADADRGARRQPRREPARSHRRGPAGPCFDSHDGVVLPHELAGVTRAVPLFEDQLVMRGGSGAGPARVR